LNKRLLILGLALLPATAFAETLRVVTTTPDLADVARKIGGEKVEAQSLALGFQNPHFVEAKPSLITKLMKADLFIQTGLELEVGWAPLLLQGARNKNILPGAAGFLDASTAVTPIEVPQNVSRSMGDVHPGGNPHYMLDPDNARLVARLIAAKMSALRPSDAAAFKDGLAAFETELGRRAADWKKTMEPLRGAKYVSYHKDASYFARAYGLVSLGEIEPKPGIPPTASHTAALIDRVKAEGARLVLTAPWYEDRTPRFIAKETGAAVIVTTNYPGALPEAKDYFSAMDHNVRAVADALAKVGAR